MQTGNEVVDMPHILLLVKASPSSLHPAEDFKARWREVAEAKS